MPIYEQPEKIMAEIESLIQIANRKLSDLTQEALVRRKLELPEDFVTNYNILMLSFIEGLIHFSGHRNQDYLDSVENGRS